MRNKIIILIIALLTIPAMSLAARASTVVLQWDATTDTTVTAQKVYYDTQGTPPFKGSGATQGSSGFLVAKGTGATISGLDPTKTYYFAITNWNGTLSMESIYSNIVIIPAFPTPPANLRAISINVTP